MKIVVFGASRGTGLYAVNLAIEGGHDVTAIARHISAAKYTKGAYRNGHFNLSVVNANVMEPSTFEHVLPGSDVVVSAIGAAGTGATTLYSQGTANIISAMEKYNVPRLLCISGLGVEVTPGMSFPLKLVTKFIVQPLLRNNFTDLLKMEKTVRQSDLNWTIIRAPRLTNGALTGRYRLAANEYLRNPLTIGRADLAHFIVNNINNSQCFCSRVEIAY